MKLQKELDEIIRQLDDLLTKGSNDENLVSRKRELEAKIRKSKSQ